MTMTTKEECNPLRGSNVDADSQWRSATFLQNFLKSTLMSAIGNFSSKFSQRHSSFPSLILDAGCAMVSLYDEIRHLFGTIMFIECTFK